MSRRANTKRAMPPAAWSASIEMPIAVRMNCPRTMAARRIPAESANARSAVRRRRPGSSYEVRAAKRTSVLIGSTVAQSMSASLTYFFSVMNHAPQYSPARTSQPPNGLELHPPLRAWQGCCPAPQAHSLHSRTTRQARHHRVFGRQLSRVQRGAKQSPGTLKRFPLRTRPL